MADVTTRYSFPFQEATDPPDGASLGQELAEAVETALGDVEDRVDTNETDIATLDGRLDTLEGRANEKAAKQFISSQSTFNSSSYASIPGISTISFTKSSTSSQIRVDMKTLFFSSATSTGLQLGVQINGTDYDVAKGYTTEANSYKPASGFAVVTSSLAAGNYTVTARWKVFSGSGNINTSSGISELDWSLREVLN